MAEREREKSLRAFLVDDDKDTLDVMMHQFKKLQIDVTGVSESTNALKEFLKSTMRNGPFDLVALDIRMPNLNGNELAKQIRETGYEGLIVALTAATSGTGRRESKESGFDYYFNKTSITKELLTALINETSSTVDRYDRQTPDLDE